MRLTLMDYGAGNLHSLRKALEKHGAEVRLGTGPDGADGLVLPGVGAFGAAARTLAPFRDPIRRAAADGLPVLGICLGMQLLLDGSAEGAGHGLGLVPGRVRRLRARRVPHMGWNRVTGDDPVIGGATGDRFYFANSYVVEPHDPADIIALSSHDGDRFPSVIRRGTVLGTQFHPEKSGEVGARLLARWVRSLRAAVPVDGEALP